VLVLAAVTVVARVAADTQMLTVVVRTMPPRSAFTAIRLAAKPSCNRITGHMLTGRARTTGAFKKTPISQPPGGWFWNASSIYVPVLVIAGEFEYYSFPVDREGLMRELTNAAVKRSVTVKNATHFLLFEKPRFELFEAVDAFLKE
jgi:pimeloyl-ACP methyl ester carboxylesterase